MYLDIQMHKYCNSSNGTCHQRQEEENLRDYCLTYEQTEYGIENTETEHTFVTRLSNATTRFDLMPHRRL